MKYKTQRLVVRYEREFNPPIFWESHSIAQVLKGLYSLINPKYPVPMTNLQALAGNSLADTGAKVILFNGNGVIEIGSEKFTAHFMNLANQQDIETVKDCVSLAEEGLCQAIPEIKFKNAKIKTSSWLSIEDSEKEKDEIFRKFGNPNFAIEEEAFNTTEIEYRPSGTLKNKNDGWVVNFQLEKSQISGSDLFFIFDIEYLDGGKYNRLEDRADHASSTCFKILAHFGLEPVNGFGKD